MCEKSASWIAATSNSKLSTKEGKDAGAWRPKVEVTQRCDPLSQLDKNPVKPL